MVSGSPELPPAMSQAFRRDFILPPLPSSLPPPLLEAYDNIERSPEDRQAIPMILPVIILFFFLVSFFTIYLFRDILHYVSNAWIVHRGGLDRPSQMEEPTEPPSGLHPLILASFPVFPYASIKRLKRKYGLVCAICLSEFSDDDTVRLLTVCNHAFHPECIDTWLASHVTCPVCRCDLEKKPEEPDEMAPGEVDGEEEGSCRISVEEEAEASSGANEEKPPSYSRRNSRRRGDHGEEEEDEYTLRLPEDVGERLVYLRSASLSGSQSAATSVAKDVDHHSGS